MTRKSTTIDKARALFLAALMVLSVFGGSIAFAGGSALAATAGPDDQQVSAQTTHTFSVTTDSAGNVDKVKLDYNDTSTDFSNVGAGDVSITTDGTKHSGNAISSVSTEDGVLTIELGSAVDTSVIDGATVKATVGEVVNPAETGHYTVKMNAVASSDGSSLNSGDQEASFDIIDSDNVASIVYFDAEVTSSQEIQATLVTDEELGTESDDVVVSYEAGETSGTIELTSDGTANDNGTYTYTDTSSSGLSDGSYTVELTSAKDANDNDAASQASSVTVTVDQTGPKFDYVNPSDGAKLKSVPDVIDIAINDTLNEVNSDSIEVEMWVEDGDDDDQYDSGADTLLIDNVDVNEPNDGISYADGNLTIDSSANAIPDLPDGVIAVKVTAEDAQGNQNTLAGDFAATESDETGYAFTLDTGANFGFSLDKPAETDDGRSLVTGSSTQTVEVGVDGSDTNSAFKANISISNESSGTLFTHSYDGTAESPDGDDASTADDSWEATSNTFIVKPGTDTGAEELVEGDYTIKVNATDSFGNMDEQSFTLTVDKTGPNVTSVDVMDNEISEDDDSTTVNISFNEPVKEDSIDLKVYADESSGAEGTISSGSTTADSDGYTWSYTSDDKSSVQLTDVDLSVDDFDNGSAMVEVDAAQDLVDANGPNSINQKGNATFALDTKVPTVSWDSPPSEFIGYTNLTKYANVNDKDDDVTVQYFWSPDGGTSGWYKIDQPKYFHATYDAPDGNIEFKVNITDDVGNEDVSSVHAATVDGETTEITSTYSDNQVVSNELNLSAAFDSPNLGVGQDISFEVDSDDSGTDGSSVSENTDGYYLVDTTGSVDGVGYGNADGKTLTVKAMVTDNGQTITKTVDLTVDHADVSIDTDNSEADGVSYTGTNDDGDLQVAIDADEKLDELTVYANSTDSFRNSVSKELSLVTAEADGDDTGYTYVYNLSDVRDGQYKVNVVSASNDSRDALTTGDTTIKHDSRAPNVTDVDIIDAAKDSTTFRLQFDEPVDEGSISTSTVDGVDHVIDSGTISVEGSSADVTTTETTQDDDGTFNITVLENVQTGDEPNVTVSGSVVDERFADSVDPNYDGSQTTASTIELSLSKGENVVSIPAASGSISADEIASHENVESIWAYDAENDEWVNYNSAANNEFDTLEGGQGYIVKATGNATIDLNVYNQVGGDTLESSTPTQQGLDKGWNLVGHYQEGSQALNDGTTPGDALHSISGSYTTVLGQNTDGDLNYASASTLEPGEGYWVFVTEDGVIYAEESL